MVTFHYVCMPHTLMVERDAYCAYQSKCRRLAVMLRMYGHKAYVYGPDVVSNDVVEAAEEYVPVVFEQDRINWFGAPEWDRTRGFDRWDPSDVCWTTMNTRTITEMRKRWTKGDQIGLIMGRAQEQVAVGIRQIDPTAQIVEWGIGYKGVMEQTNKVFESYAWAHHLAALRSDDNVRYFDTVIPNCFDYRDYKYSSKPGQYLLFIGRPAADKGLSIVQEITDRSPWPVKIAGQPGHGIRGAEYVGIVSGKEKRELFAGAVATLVPTMYLEPFGGVAVESMMSGTPAITTDWGAFTETVKEGVSGFRCRTLAEFMRAIEQAPDLSRTAIRRYAVENYSLAAGARMYSEYLEKVATLGDKGWYQTD